MNVINGPGPQYVFVSGLHRSGTSLVARMIGRLPGVGAIENAPVPENEGVYLQGGISHHARHGIPMHFATDPDQHLTEHHPLNRLETRQRIIADWDPWFPGHSLWRVEKSPVNLTRMRLLQQLFPMAHFVVVIRHPEVVAAAVSKWVDHPASYLIDHWLEAHDRLLQDFQYLHAATIIRYEDITHHPDQAYAALASFLDLPLPIKDREAIRDGNADYAGGSIMSPLQDKRSALWGYGINRAVEANWPPLTRHPLRSIKERTEQVFRATPQTASDM